MPSAAVRINPQQTCRHSPPCGCEDISGCCMKCPLPICIHEDPRMTKRLKNQTRDETIIALKGKLKARQVAALYAISPKTVYEIWKQKETNDALSL